MRDTPPLPATRRTLLGLGLAAAGLGIAPRRSHAQTMDGWPQRPVKIIVPYPPGGPTDIVARLIGQRLQARTKQPFLVDNKPGAGGNIGAEVAAKAPADGTVLLVGTTAHAINPSLFASLNYDIRKDFAPIALLTSMPLVLVVPASSSAASVADVIAMAKAKPGALPYGSSGNGQSTHLAAELFATMAGAPMTHVPYKGSAPALTDLAGGQVALMFDTMLSAMPQVKVWGIGGKPRTPTLKVSIGCTEGFIGEDMFFYAGPGAPRRAQLAKRVPHQDRTREVIGVWSALEPREQVPASVHDFES